MTERWLDGWTVAFDLDGTLVDTAPDLIGALNVILADEGLPALPVAAARSLVGRGAGFLIEHGFAAEGVTLPLERLGPMVDRFIDIYLGRIAVESRPFPGCVQALERLAADGAQLAVCTNKRTDLSLTLLDALKLTDRFAAVFGADRASAAKPDRRHLEEAVAAAGGRPDRAIMVGDSATDVGAAQAAGVPCVVVDFGYTETPPHALGGDVLISHFDALPPAVRELVAATARVG